jgi:chemotaxis protein CheC
MHWILNEIEKDLFKEIANIGLSKAADALAVLAKQKVLLNVPDIQLINPDKIFDVVVEDTEKAAIVIRSDIKGDIEGKTLIMFSQHYVDKFIVEIIDSVGEFDGDKKKLTESILMELSNIVTGSIITQFANIFHLKIYGSVPTGPQYNVTHSLQELLKDFPSFQPLIFTIKTKFVNNGKYLELPLLIVFDTDTLLKLLSIIRSNNKNNYNFLLKN